MPGVPSAVSLFLAVFFSLYAILHWYAFLKARAAFHFGLATGIGLASFMLLMLSMPFIIHYLERYGLDSAARPAAFAGYTWMGVLFLFCSVALPLDCTRVALNLSASVSPYLFTTALVLSLAITIYGYFEAGNIRTERISIKSAKIPEGPGIRVVQISDVHLGLIVREGRLRSILEAVKRAGPDILVCTGDLVDGQISRLNGLADMLREIKPRYGKFAITGNHEFYAGIRQSLKFTEEAGFTILRGRSVQGPVVIAGVDDPTANAFGPGPGGPAASEDELLKNASEAGKKFTILLKHRPLVNKASAGLFDLQLSGHVHKGQICPFGILTKLYYPLDAGLGKLPGGSHLYVSRGSGTWGPPIRFMAPPEITIIDLVHN